jgi:hypothetical protein
MLASKYYQNLEKKVERRILFLPTNSLVRIIYSKKIKKQVNKILNECEEPNYLPPLFFFILRHSVVQIKSFEHDLSLIIKKSAKNEKKIIENFLSAPANDQYNNWMGGIFEIFIKTRLLKNKNIDIVFDEVLPNRRDVDAKIIMNDKIYYLESTVFNDSAEDKIVWTKYLEDKKNNSKAVFGRPGKYDMKNSKSPSPYYDCTRFYNKVYDKLAYKLNATKGQISNEHPNIFLIYVNGCVSPLGGSPGIYWALDELFIEQPRMFNKKDKNDISLCSWLDNLTNINTNDDIDNFNKLVTLPKKIGAILLFSQSSMIARVNYNADKECSLSHAEIFKFESIFKSRPIWFKG